MLYLILFVAGLALLVTALYYLRTSMALIKSGERARATVVCLEAEKDSDGGTVYSPVFTYRTYTNEERLYHHPVATGPASWRVGEEAVLVYDPSDSDRVKLLTYFGAFGTTIVLVAIALPLLVIGGGYFVARMVLK